MKKDLDDAPSLGERRRWGNPATPPSHHNLLRLLYAYEKLLAVGNKMANRIENTPPTPPHCEGTLMEAEPEQTPARKMIDAINKKVGDVIEYIDEHID